MTTLRTQELKNNSGIKVSLPGWQGVFLNPRASIDDLKNEVSQAHSAQSTGVASHFAFHRLLQTHSSTVVSANVSAGTTTAVDDPFIVRGFTEGDGLEGLRNTSRLDVLGVATADCLPLFIFLENKYFCLHAGWRGIQNEIILKALSSAFSDQTTLRSFAFIGPHIQWTSFEVDASLGESFYQQAQKYKAFYQPFHSSSNACFNWSEQIIRRHNQKTFIHLSALATLQLLEAGLRFENIWSSSIDTKTNLDWASYRRDPHSGLRNLSYCWPCQSDPILIE